jgi:hypothetical protein
VIFRVHGCLDHTEGNSKGADSDQNHKHLDVGDNQVRVVDYLRWGQSLLVGPHRLKSLVLTVNESYEDLE